MLTTPELRRAWAPACAVRLETVELVQGVCVIWSGVWIM